MNLQKSSTFIELFTGQHFPLSEPIDLTALLAIMIMEVLHFPVNDIF